MIKITSKTVQIEGHKYEIYKDVAHLFMAIKENGLFDEKELHEAVELAFLSDDELEKRAMKDLKELKESLEKMLNPEGTKEVSKDFFEKMFGDLEDK